MLQSQSGEQRLSLRSTPHEVLTLRHRLDGPGLAEVAALARRGMVGDWIVPLWMMAERSGQGLSATDITVPVAVAHADYRAPGFAVAAADGGAAHLLEVAAVRPDGIDLAVPAGFDLTRPVIAPARRARLLAPLDRPAPCRARVRHRTLPAAGQRRSLRAQGCRALHRHRRQRFHGGAKIAAAMAAVQALVEELGSTVPPVLRNDICVVLWDATVSGMRLYRDADRSDFADLSAWLSGPVTLGGATDFEAALSEAPGFFAGAGARRRIVLFLTDGAPSPSGSAAAAVVLRDTIADVEVFGFNIGLTNTAYTAMLDNTGVDGVPVIASGDTDALRDILLGTLFGIPRSPWPGRADGPQPDAPAAARDAVPGLRGCRQRLGVGGSGTAA